MRIPSSARLVSVGLVLGALAFAPPARAFCGFYVGGADAKLFNNATQVVMMRDGTRTVLSMQNNYQGPPEGFAMVVPVPVVLQEENVKTLARGLFEKVDALSAPRLVEYWEQDPCYEPPKPKGGLGRRRTEAAEAVPAPLAAAPADHGVTIEAQFAVGEYDIVILGAKDAAGLDTWLKENKYKIPEGAEPLFRPYIQRGSKFFVAKVDPKKVTFKDGMATLSPLRFHYDEDTFQLPVRLGLINADSAQDLIVNVLARKQRYEPANYPSVTIPTNFDVSEKARPEFGSFYAALFDKTLEQHPKAVVTEYSWATGTCDPCPGPALGPGDMEALGGDVLPKPEGCPPPGQPYKPGTPYRPECQPWSRYSDFVVTRMHARYTKAALGEDLVFRVADPISGGREVRSGPGGELEHGAAKSSVNNFQARYAIRHPWTGPITCASPRRGVWGGPPARGDAPATSAPPPKAAKDLAFAKRDVSLAAFMRSDVPELGLRSDPAAAPPVSGVGNDKKASRCGCEAVGARTSGGGAIATVLAALTVWLRRAQRRRAPETPSSDRA